jgi:hypothetical protein
MGQDDCKRQLVLRWVGIMGYLEIIDGSGYTARFDDDGVHVIPSDIKCDLCDDDRILQDGRCANCLQIGDA